MFQSIPSVFNPRFNDNGRFTTPHNVTFDRDRDFLDCPQNTLAFMAKYVPNLAPLYDYFSRAEVATLLAKRQSMSITPGDRMMVFASYENPWAKAGGVLAVARMGPEALEAAGERVIRISPDHSNLKSSLGPESGKVIAQFRVPLNNGADPVLVQIREVYESEHSKIPWYLISAPGYFDLDGGENRTDPYFDSRDKDRSQVEVDRKSARDALFFSKALPYALRALGHRRDVYLELQDWQTAATALFVLEAQLRNGNEEPVLESAATFSTLHNPYDKWLPRDLLADFTTRAEQFALSGADTFLAQFLRLTAGPVSTVSGGFARGIMESPLMTELYARHLIRVLFEQGFIGITNGPLAKLETPFGEEAEARASIGQYDVIKLEKEVARKVALSKIREHQESPTRNSIGALQGGSTGFVGGDITTLDPSVPIITVYGRFDLGQKGIDVAIDAIRKMPPGMARYVVIGMTTSSDEYVGQHHAAYQRLADERPGEFLFFKASCDFFKELMKGTSFVAYPSIYEPYGSVADAWVNGAGVIGRAVDGLAHQMMPRTQKLAMPNQPVPSFNEPFLPIITYHEGVPRGIDLVGEFKALQETMHPGHRVENPVFQAMSGALRDAMIRACSMFSAGSGDRYYRGLAEVPKLAGSREGELSGWEINARQRQAWMTGAILASRR
jgi:glycogen synthase